MHAWKFRSCSSAWERFHDHPLGCGNHSWEVDYKLVVAHVVYGEISKRLATPRNTKDKKHLQSTQCDTVYLHATSACGTYRNAACSGSSFLNWLQNRKTEKPQQERTNQQTHVKPPCNQPAGTGLLCVATHTDSLHTQHSHQRPILMPHHDINTGTAKPASPELHPLGPLSPRCRPPGLLGNESGPRLCRRTCVFSVNLRDEDVAAE